MPTTEMTAKDKAYRNDKMRANIMMPHRDDRVMLTQGINSLGAIFAMEAVMTVRDFTDFSEGNDPYKERDFGKFTLSTGDDCFWKIDDYNGQEGLRLVLTIMLAEDW